MISMIERALCAALTTPTKRANILRFQEAVARDVLFNHHLGRRELIEDVLWRAAKANRIVLRLYENPTANHADAGLMIIDSIDASMVLS